MYRLNQLAPRLCEFVEPWIYCAYACVDCFYWWFEKNSTWIPWCLVNAV